MKNTKKQLILSQTDKKLEKLQDLKEVSIPPRGWLHTLRTALQMSLRQLSAKASITPQSLKDMESREVAGTITLNTLRDVANAMDLQLVYGFVSKHESLEQMIEKRAKELATEIVMRTNNTMALENQQNSKERISQAIAEKTAEIKFEMPKYLWD
jgi:predicted DNA-binding mobile mystery protein A